MSNPAKELQDFDPAEYIDTPELQAELLEEAFATGDQAFILDAIGTIARARGMTELQRETGLNRTTLYAALGKGGNPRFETILAVMKALGMRLSVAPEGDLAR